jgi:hypothetical protein
VAAIADNSTMSMLLNDDITSAVNRHTQKERQKSHENSSEINLGARIWIFSLYPNLSVSSIVNVANNAMMSVK